MNAGAVIGAGDVITCVAAWAEIGRGESLDTVAFADCAADRIAIGAGDLAGAGDIIASVAAWTVTGAGDSLGAIAVAGWVAA